MTAEELDNAVESIIIELLKGGPNAVAHCKQVIFKIAGHSADSQEITDKLTAKLIANLRVSPEGQEGLAAFLEKRTPQWVKDNTSNE